MPCVGRVCAKSSRPWHLLRLRGPYDEHFWRGYTFWLPPRRVYRDRHRVRGYRARMYNGITLSYAGLGPGMRA